MPGMFDLGMLPGLGGQQQQPPDATQSLKVMALMNQLRSKDQQNQTPAGAAGSSLMTIALMYPDLFRQMGSGVGNLLSGATQSAWSQQANPYGATGNGMAPIVGSTGMVGGGA